MNIESYVAASTTGKVPLKVRDKSVLRAVAGMLV
jgi:hypothetical protein